MIDLRATRADGRLAEFAARDISQVQARYVGTSYTDLLLFAQPGATTVPRHR